MTVEELEAGFRPRGITRGGLLFLRPQDAVALVEAAKDAGIRVLGADAFRILDEGTQPLLEHSIDVTRGAPTTHQDQWDMVSGFVRRYVGSDLYFEVVLSEAKGRV